ncbi:MAG: hypothetical protein Fur003_1590 [Candidatus Dojkabacteria bacterium]
MFPKNLGIPQTQVASPSELVATPGLETHRQVYEALLETEKGSQISKLVRDFGYTAQEMCTMTRKQRQGDLAFMLKSYETFGRNLVTTFPEITNEQLVALFCVANLDDMERGCRIRMFQNPKVFPDFEIAKGNISLGASSFIEGA